MIDLIIVFIFGFLLGIGLRAAQDALDGVRHDANEYGSER